MSQYNIRKLLDAAVGGDPVSASGYPDLQNIGSKSQPAYMKRSDEFGLRGSHTYDRVTSLSSAPSSFANSASVQVPFNLNSLQTETIQDVFVEFSITNASGSTVFPTSTNFWIDRIEIYAGANYLETVYGDHCMAYGLMENDTTDWYDVSTVSNQTLTFPLNGYHNASGIATATTGSFFIKLPRHSITEAFIWLPALAAPVALQYRLYLNGNNIYTSGATGLTINQIFLDVMGVKFAADARDGLMKVHRSGPMISRCNAFQRQIFTIGNIPAGGQIVQTLTGLGIAIAEEVMFFLRPTAPSGTGYFELNYQIASLVSLTNERNEIIAQSLQENFLRTLSTGDYEGSTRGDFLYVLPFTISLKNSAENYFDIGGLVLNNANQINIQTLLSTGSSYDLIVLVKQKSALVTSPDGTLQLIKL